jgi:F-type H+-transporting ATPase subunit b
MTRPSLLALALLGVALGFGVPGRNVLAAADDTPAAKTEAAGHGDGHGAEKEPNILEPQLPLAFWTVIVFVVLLLVLWKYAWGPLSKALHDREHHIEHTLEEAEKARRESERFLAEHRAQMAAAAEQARAILDEARRAAEATANEIVQKAQSEAEAARIRAEREIGSARDQALIEIWSKTADLAISVAGRVLSRELSPDDQRRLIQVAVSELPSTNGQGSHA